MLKIRFSSHSDDRGPRGHGEVPEGVRLQHLLRAQADGHRLRLSQAVDKESGHLRLRAPHHTGQFCFSCFLFFWIFILLCAINQDLDLSLIGVMFAQKNDFRHAIKLTGSVQAL
jgi:hypothetical protein